MARRQRLTAAQTAVLFDDPRRSIPTIYGATRFRSKLEADWARTLDALGAEWAYEREGRYYGDVFYLPDFWLPASRQILEVKGEVEPEDIRKWLAVLKHTPARLHTGADTPDIPLIVARPDGVFYGFQAPHPATDFADFVLCHARPVELARCVRCRGWWALDTDGGWGCQCCGYAAGASTFAQVHRSPVEGWPLTPTGEGE